MAPSYIFAFEQSFKIVAKKKFNEAEAIDKALDLFWEKGYEATSMRDLIAHLNITTGSLYDSFGSKDKLFAMCYDAYNAKYIKGLMKELEKENSGSQAIVNFFNAMLQSHSGLRGEFGCFMTNTITELGYKKPPIADRSIRQLAEVEEAFFKAVKRGQERGEIRTNIEAHELAAFLTTTFQGMNVMIKVHNNPLKLMGVVNMTLKMIK